MVEVLELQVDLGVQDLDLVELAQAPGELVQVGLGMYQVGRDLFWVGLGMDQAEQGLFLGGLGIGQGGSDPFIEGLGMDQVVVLGTDQVELHRFEVEEQEQELEVN